MESNLNSSFTSFIAAVAFFFSLVLFVVLIYKLVTNGREKIYDRSGV
jgi:hypothetical protein